LDRDDFGWIRVGWGLVPGLVGAMPVEVIFVSGENFAGVGLAEQQDVVGAFRSDSPNPAFRPAVRSRPAWRGSHDVDAFGGEHGVEGLGEVRAAVADEEPEVPDPALERGHEITGLLGNPLAGRMRRDAHDVDVAGSHLHHEQDIEPFQSNGVDVKQIGRQDPVSLRGEERSPGGVGASRRGRNPPLLQDPADRALADTVPEPTQFALYETASIPTALLCPLCATRPVARIWNIRKPGARNAGRTDTRNADQEAGNLNASASKHFHRWTL
jgi:hypothetical protein